MSKLTRQLRNVRGLKASERPIVKFPELPKHITAQNLKDDPTLRERMTSQYGTEPVMKRMGLMGVQDGDVDGSQK